MWLGWIGLRINVYNRKFKSDGCSFEKWEGINRDGLGSCWKKMNNDDTIKEIEVN